MGIMAYFQFCVIMLCVQSICALPQSVVVHSLFHHKDPLLGVPYSMELVVFYASGGLPKICAVEDTSIRAGRMTRRMYRIDSVSVDASVMKRFPLVSDHGYTVLAQQLGKSLELIITYDSASCMVGLSTFNTIGNQAGFALHLCPTRVVVRNSKTTCRQKIVVIDCGHGGADTGALSTSGMQEKELVLAVGSRMKKILQDYGITVIMTRTADSDVFLDERTSLANTYDPDLFVSLHANYAASQHASGIETWYISGILNVVPGCSDSRAIAYIQDTMRHRSVNSLVPATYIHKELVAGAKQYSTLSIDRQIKSAISQVLLGCRKPALLVELGFLSNIAESKRLMTGMYQDMQARSLCAGIVDYFTYLDKLGK